MLRFAIIFVAVCLPAAALGHPGGLDASGGHHDRKNGGYHYHRSPPRDPEPPPPSPIREAPVARTTARTSYRDDARTEARTEDARSLTAKEFPVTKAVSGWAGLSEQDRREQMAAAKLRFVKQLLNDSNETTAKHVLTKLITEYPDTKAGKEGIKLAKELGMPDIKVEAE